MIGKIPTIWRCTLGHEHWDWFGQRKLLRCRPRGHDGNSRARAATFLISCIDSGAAGHRGVSSVLGTCNQRREFESPGGCATSGPQRHLACPTDHKAHSASKRQFPELSSPPEAASLVSDDTVCRALAEAHPQPMPGRQEQSDAHGRMPSRRRPRARLLRSDRPAFVYDGRDLYARIVLQADGWHAVLEASRAVLGPFPTRERAILFCNARKACTAAAPIPGERAADANHIKKIQTRQRQAREQR